MTEAITISDEIADSQRRARALTVLAETLSAMGDFPGARAHCLEAFGIIGDITDPEVDSLLDRLLAIESSAAGRVAVR